MTKFEQYQNAIDALTTRQIASGKGWNSGFQLMIDKLTEACNSLTIEEAGELV